MTLPLYIPHTSVELETEGEIGRTSGGVAVDSSGNVYITGLTDSANFPATPNPIQIDNAGDYDVFVTKINADGTLGYSTYLGGSAWDRSGGIAVDSNGNAYITGTTISSDFPNTLITIQPGGYADGGDAFVTKINADGTLGYSTYLGGSSYEDGNGIAVDSSGNVYITGATYSTDFPTWNPIQPNNASTYDVFVTKINADGTPGYSTYLGGSGNDAGTGIAVDSDRNAYITGYTYANNFPYTLNAYQTINAGNADAFVTKINADGSNLVYSTYLGGSEGEGSYGIALDSDKNAYITGATNSADFPIKDPIYNSGNLVGGTGTDVGDVFVTKINADGSDLVYSTFLGGSTYEEGHGIAVDSDGNAYITGFTYSTDFITQHSIQPKGGDVGDRDVFVTAINTAGPGLCTPHSSVGVTGMKAMV